MIESKEVGVAKSMLRQSSPMTKLKEADAERYLRLEYLLPKGSIDAFVSAAELYKEKDKILQRMHLASEVLKDLQIAPSNRLLNLLKDSIQHQNEKNLIPPLAHSSERYNLFTASIQASITINKDTIPNTKYRELSV